jgi:hypothetical protein
MCFPTRASDLLDFPTHSPPMYVSWLGVSVFKLYHILNKFISYLYKMTLSYSLVINLIIYYSVFSALTPRPTSY